MKLNFLSDELIIKLKELENDSSDIINTSTRALVMCRSLLKTFRKHIIENGFESTQDEIQFFKHTKQPSLTNLIYYCELRSFEMKFPKANDDAQKKYIKKKINKLNKFFLYNMEFVQYIKSNSIHFDEQYFTRAYFDSCLPITSSKLYFQDPEFNTARSVLLAKYRAYNSFTIYLKNRLNDKNKPTTLHSNPINNNTNLQWTSSKTALTELIYALHQSRAINNGNVDIKEIAMLFQKTLHFDIGDFYKTFSEIKSRKISRTKFLDDLSTGLISHMNNSDE
ncbi:RteC domain-containing protein [Tamlana sp. 2_MG-2023]|uniref:RteC domain-containing protein n=1 Tax=unclassified Tamlana TaxID=2614803 RepID=UPI0026E47D07|nr:MULTISPECIES: RteC domain-containing protein [unclassified Tamlana]MDO6761624.1 RteC domain-containing protein [Tamlana sp. 2_MG-2023]MDO6792450.1 RteC domain-containing protein [Tamlana sp. 1_MG-2023]